MPSKHETVGAVVAATIERSSCLAEAAALWKRLFVRELMRRGAKREEVYTAIEMDHAQQEAAFWSVEGDGHGNFAIERAA